MCFVFVCSWTQWGALFFSCVDLKPENAYIQLRSGIHQEIHWHVLPFLMTSFDHCFCLQSSLGIISLDFIKGFPTRAAFPLLISADYVTEMKHVIPTNGKLVVSILLLCLWIIFSDFMYFRRTLFLVLKSPFFLKYGRLPSNPFHFGLGRTLGRKR